jgi:hypothetical protein
MCPSFIALFTKAGIACAADTDHTIYSLSKEYPVAIAVNPASSIPWERIIEDYRRLPAQAHPAFQDYGVDFEKYLKTVPFVEGPRHFSEEDAKIILMGFGTEEIFPSGLEIIVGVKDGSLCFQDVTVDKVCHRDYAFFHLLGNHESISTLLWGSTTQVKQVLYNEQLETFQKYARRVTEKFQGTKYEEYVKKHLEAYTPAADIESIMQEATEQAVKEWAIGLDSFGVDGMVTAAESLIKANVNLNRLRAGAKDAPVEVREIAVITIPEGLTWIKHSLFFRRNEL